MTCADKNTVALHSCDSYDEAVLKELILKSFDELGIHPADYRGKQVMLKPNLVRRMDASQGGTTHPNMLAATAMIFMEAGADVMVAESPGGPYNAAALKLVYRGCGIEAAAERVGIPICYGSDIISHPCPKGEFIRSFNLIKPTADADLIVNLCKLKSHGLTKMTAAVKNYFGCVPGVEKVEMHARFPERRDFCGMLIDLCRMITDMKPTISILDAIVGMEGNGPTNGTPRKLGFMMVGCDPFVMDRLACEMIGYEDTVLMVEMAKERGLAPADLSEITVLGEDYKALCVTDFKAPDSDAAKALKLLPNIFGGRLNRFLQPKPAIDKPKCVGCGECVRSCPMKTIEIKEKKANINTKNCISCFCCQELCPKDAVKIHKNWLIKVIG
ncbi:MAG: DUF362 domain-containing protein [Clostridia bacterium]|nr:DUF362 domain-containing protein [Clostridia bacterium]